MIIKEDETLSQITSIIIKAVLPDRIILFGSRASGNAKSNSDYDFIVIKKNVSNERTVSSAVYRALFENKIKAAVDIIAVDAEKRERVKDDANLIHFTALKEGRALYG